MCDPLAGGGTTLFTALTLGADVVGVEQNAQDVQSTATFLRQYAREAGIVCKIKEERLKKLGKRWLYLKDAGENSRHLEKIFLEYM